MKPEKDKIDMILVFLILFLSTRASGLSVSNVFLFGSLLFTIWIAAARKLRVDKPFVVFFIFLLLVILQNLFSLGEYFDTLRYLKLLSLILTAYLTVKIVGFRFFFHYNRIVLKAIWFSLPFYIFQLADAGTLHKMGKLLNGIFPGLMDVSVVIGNESLNILFYTIEFVENFRNSGPMWEPGGFAMVIVLALFFELLQNDFRFSRKCWIYLAGILITFSTTGYLTTLLVLFFFLLVKAKRSKSRYLKPVLYLALPAFSVLSVIVFFNTSIFYDKISTEIGSQREVIENISDYGDTFKSLGRFGSLQMDLESIREKFIFGRGYTDEDFRTRYEQFNFTNGLSSFVGRMGLVGLCWLLFSLYRSGRLILYGLTGSTAGSWIFLFLVLLITFSNPVLFTPLFLVFQLFYIPFKPKLHEKYQDLGGDRSPQPEGYYTELSPAARTTELS